MISTTQLSSNPLKKNSAPNFPITINLRKISLSENSLKNDRIGKKFIDSWRNTYFHYDSRSCPRKPRGRARRKRSTRSHPMHIFSPVSLSGRWKYVNGSNPLDVLTQLRWILAPLPADPPFPFFPSRSMTLQAYYRQIVNVG